MVLWRPTRPYKTNTKKDVLFLRGDWNSKVGSQETPGVTGKFGLGIQNEAGQRTDLWPSDFTSGYLPEENKNTNLKKIYAHQYSWKHYL